MRREYPLAPVVGVGAVIVEHDRALLVKRRHAPLADAWSIPGGALELGETIRDALVREVREETGLSVEVADLLGIFDRIIRDAKGEILYHYILIDFLCRITGGECRARDDAKEIRWFTLDEITTLSLPEDTAEVLRLGFEKKRLKHDLPARPG
ncbi:MAG: NUDIX hydrolase [Acidobacteriales bacterium]|nr:NUDIX hydrolase [Terriglobales bacterium]